MKSGILLLVIANAFNVVYGQSTNAQIQSIELKHAQETKLFSLVNESNTLLKEEKSTDALVKVKKALEISFEIENKRGEAYSYQTLGAIYFNKRNFTESSDYYEKAKKIFKTINESNAYYKTLRALTMAYEAGGQFESAISSYKEFLGLALKKQTLSDEIYAKQGLGRSLFNLKRFKEANTYYQQLLVAYRTSNDEGKVAEMYDYIGRCYAGEKDTVNALKYFGLAGTLGDSYTTDIAQRNSWQNVGRSYSSIGEYDQSVSYEKKAKEINKRNKDYKSVYSNNTNIANDYLFMNRAKEAIPLLLENVNISDGIGELKSTGETYKALSDAYAQLGKLEQAKMSFKQYVEVQEKLLAQREIEINKIAVENAQFADKENQIELLIKDKELDEGRIVLLERQKQMEFERASQQKNIIYVLAGLVLLFCIGLTFFYRSSKQRKLANKLLSIRSLRSQMNPHFIFNSLNSVNSFISQSDERSANKYLSEFARLMRTVLDHSKQDFVVLSAEIEVLKRYLSLEHIRFQDQFDYQFYVDDEIEVDRLLIPPMLVQPYIENAIWHGLRYKKEKGTLKVSFLKEDNAVKIIIKDDGIGREESKHIKTRNQKQGKSTGIKNTASRLQLINDVHGIPIKSNIQDLNENGTGTHVEIKLPLIDVDDKKLVESVEY